MRISRDGNGFLHELLYRTQTQGENKREKHKKLGLLQEGNKLTIISKPRTPVRSTKPSPSVWGRLEPRLEKRAQLIKNYVGEMGRVRISMIG